MVGNPPLRRAAAIILGRRCSIIYIVRHADELYRALQIDQVYKALDTSYSIEELEKANSTQFERGLRLTKPGNPKRRSNGTAAPCCEEKVGPWT